MDRRIEAASSGVSVRASRTRRGKAKGLYGLVTRALGKEILVVGPSTAGKTKFTEYLRLGTLDPEGRREMTYHVRKSPAFTVGIGGERPLVLKVRRAVDTPGQIGPLQHATLVGRRKPHAIIIVLDCSRPLSTTVTWLHLFCDRLDTVLRRGSYVKRKLSQILVLLNKRDKIDDGQLDQCRQAVRGVLAQHLSVVLGEQRVQSLGILECISVQSEQGTVLIDGAIDRLAQRLVQWGTFEAKGESS